MKQIIKNITCELQIDMPTILNTVSNYLGVGEDEILERRQNMPVVVYREIMFYFCFIAGHTCEEIARQFSYDRSTVRNAILNIDFWQDKYNDVSTNIKQIKIKILEKFIQKKEGL